MIERDSIILEYLKQNHKGRGKAVHSRELEDRFNICGRSLRRVVGRLRRDYHPVCSDDSGYYYGTKQAEITATVCRLDELVVNISNARTGLLRSTLRKKRG